MKVSILSIGTELTSGQILNKNATWISQKLQALGVTTQFHLTIPDEKKLIEEAFKLAHAQSQVTFVTGGLGPTSDDFTRIIYCDWTKQDLVWDEASWQHIHDRLTPRGIAVKDIQKQQCYFPKGSKILKNRMGTANGFQTDFEGHVYFFLPGPPREIEAIWEDEINLWLSSNLKSEERILMSIWDTMGVGESDIADQVVAVTRNCPYEIGYRVHLPYVEVKLTYPKKDLDKAEPWIKAIDKALLPMIATRGGKDVSVMLANQLSQFPEVQIIDEIPGSFLMQRLFPNLKGLLKDKKFSFRTSKPDQFRHDVIYLWLQEISGESGFQGKAEALWDGESFRQMIPSPYRSELLREREQQFFAEKAMLSWSTWIGRQMRG